MRDEGWKGHAPSRRLARRKHEGVEEHSRACYTFAECSDTYAEYSPKGADPGGATFEMRAAPESTQVGTYHVFDKVRFADV